MGDLPKTIREAREVVAERLTCRIDALKRQSQDAAADT